MITIPDLQAAIAECQGERNPNANTCIKLAAYHIILDHLEEKTAPAVVEQAVSPVRFSYAAPETATETHIQYDSGTEFSREIIGRKADEVWALMDELMSVLQVTQPRLYNGVLNQIREL